jgi:hypothetical protein
MLMLLNALLDVKQKTCISNIFPYTPEDDNMTLSKVASCSCLIVRGIFL